MLLFTRAQFHLKRITTDDLKSGMVLSLIALPLSIGIALASGAPPTAGLLSAIIGGILGGLIGGSELAINGPAAGLIVIVLGAIDSLGAGDPAVGFHRMLGCLIIAGMIQIFLGLLKAGKLALAVPTSVVHGMLMGIGVIIMIKQVPVLLGVTPKSKSIPGVLTELPRILSETNWEIALIGFFAVSILMVANMSRARIFNWIPAPLMVVMMGLGMDYYFDLEHVHQVEFFHRQFLVGPQYLLKLPSEIASSLFGASFSGLFTGPSLKAIVSIALVASLESILSVFAIDRMDPERRKSNFNQELISKGVCNMLLGFLGGLPIIAEIVRSSANISSGARTRWSNFFHGVFILLFVLLFKNILGSIPLSALAGILVVIGFRLGHPRQLLQSWRVGRDQGIVFTMTLFLTVFEDLLVAVAVGVILEMVLNAIRAKSLLQIFSLRRETKYLEDHAELTVDSPLVFSNFIQLEESLDELRKKKSATIDLRKSRMVDHSVMEHLHQLQNEFSTAGKNLIIKFHERHRKVGRHPLSSRIVRPRGKRSGWDIHFQQSENMEEKLGFIKKRDSNESEK